MVTPARRGRSPRCRLRRRTFPAPYRPACPECPRAGSPPAGHAHHAEIDQLERPADSRITLSGLMSRWMMPARCSAARRARQLDRDVAAFLESDRRAAREPGLQQFALVERHRRIEAGLPSRRQFDDVADPRAVHARADPCLADERRAIGRDRRHLRLREISAPPRRPRPRPARRTGGCSGRPRRSAFSTKPSMVSPPRGTGISGSCMMAAPISADSRRRQRRPRRAPARCNYRCCRRRARPQPARGRCRRERSARARCRRCVSSVRNAVHAVAAQQKAVMQRDRLAGIVQPHLASRRRARGSAVRRPAPPSRGMVVGQTGETVAPQPIGAGIADMQQMGDPAAQDERGEGASHPLQLGVAGWPCALIQPLSASITIAPPARPHLHGLRQVAEAVEKTAHRESRRRRGRPWRRQSRRRSPPPRRGAARAIPRRRPRRRNPRSPCAVPYRRRTRRSP